MTVEGCCAAVGIEAGTNLVAAIDGHSSTIEEQLTAAVPTRHSGTHTSDAVALIKVFDRRVLARIVGDVQDVEGVDGSWRHIDRQAAVIRSLDHERRIVEIDRSGQVAACQDQRLVRSNDRRAAGRASRSLDMPA
ncbi:hypothetical protein [Bradyrhizobium sp. USDA 4011]